MTGTITVNGTTGARVGNTPVFTYEQAREVFEMLARRAYSYMAKEHLKEMYNIKMDMNRLGFSCEELDEIEIKVLKELTENVATEL